MIIRDEAVNLQSNLALWLNTIDYFVFMVDSRTSDGSEQTIQNILGRKAPFEILPYTFEGFGPARTLSLKAAYKYFPDATHVFIADPDWRPDISTMKKDELDLDYDAFRFLIYDRNGDTTRRCDWLLRQREGLAMKYHLHEVLDIGEHYNMKIISWVLHEIEKPGTWHSKVGHGHSMSSKRYLFDLNLLEKDLALYRHDPHTHYYLGVTNEAYATHYYADNFDKLTPEGLQLIDHHFNISIHYLTLRITSTYEHEFTEERWACMYLLGNIYYNKVLLLYNLILILCINPNLYSNFFFFLIACFTIA